MLHISEFRSEAVKTESYRGNTACFCVNTVNYLTVFVISQKVTVTSNVSCEVASCLACTMKLLSKNFMGGHSIVQ